MGGGGGSGSGGHRGGGQHNGGQGRRQGGEELEVGRLGGYLCVQVHEVGVAQVEGEFIPAHGDKGGARLVRQLLRRRVPGRQVQVFARTVNGLRKAELGSFGILLHLGLQQVVLVGVGRQWPGGL